MKFSKIIEYLIFFLVAVFPFGVLLRIPLTISGFPEIHLYLIDLVSFLIFIFWLLDQLIFKKRPFLPFFWKDLLLFLGWLFVSWAINLKEFPFPQSLVGFLYLLRFLIFSSSCLIIFNLKKSKSNINEDFVRNCFSFWAITLSILGILQYLFIPDVRFLKFSGWDEHYFRVVGPFLDPNFMGILLVLGILNSLSLIFKGKRDKRDKGVKGEKRDMVARVSLPFLVISFLLTYSRSSYLALLVGVLTVLFLLRKLKYLFFFLFSFLFFILILPRPGGEGVKLERVTSALQRIENWQTAIIVLKKSPIFGVGFNNYRYALRNLGYLGENWRETHAGAGVDNSFLFILVTSGIIGFILFWNFWVKIIIRVFKSENKIIKISFLSSIAAVFTHSFFINSFFYSWVLVWIWLMVGLLD